MTSDWVLLICASSVIACALVAGVFLTFSDFVMKSLAAAQPAAGIEAMQIINRKVFKTVIMVLLIGMAAISPVLIGYAALALSGAAAGWVIAGGVFYFVGVFLVTVAGNVPMNQRLDALDHTSAEAAVYWQTYVPVWSRWNTLRTASSTASAVCYLVACLS